MGKPSAVGKPLESALCGAGVSGEPSPVSVTVPHAVATRHNSPTGRIRVAIAVIAGVTPIVSSSFPLAATAGGLGNLTSCVRNDQAPAVRRWVEIFFPGTEPPAPDP